MTKKIKPLTPTSGWAQDSGETIIINYKTGDVVDVIKRENESIKYLYRFIDSEPIIKENKKLINQLEKIAIKYNIYLGNKKGIPTQTAIKNHALKASKAAKYLIEYLSSREHDNVQTILDYSLPNDKFYLDNKNFAIQWLSSAEIYYKILHNDVKPIRGRKSSLLTKWLYDELEGIFKKHRLKTNGKGSELFLITLSTIEKQKNYHNPQNIKTNSIFNKVISTINKPEVNKKIKDSVRHRRKTQQ